jgi:hypothetical protein
MLLGHLLLLPLVATVPSLRLKLLHLLQHLHQLLLQRLLLEPLLLLHLHLHPLQPLK